MSAEEWVPGARWRVIYPVFNIDGGVTWAVWCETGNEEEARDQFATCPDKTDALLERQYELPQSSIGTFTEWRRTSCTTT